MDNRGVEGGIKVYDGDGHCASVRMKVVVFEYMKGMMK